VSDVLALLDRAQAAHRRETVEATAELVDGLLGTDRVVRDVRIPPRGGFVLVSVENVTARLAVPSPGQARALRALWLRGPVTLALGLVLDDGRAMLGFSGPDEDVLVSTRVDPAA
jgi:hypothetical protein